LGPASFVHFTSGVYITKTFHHLKLHFVAIS
jgi:hypothetical protein